LHDARRQDAWRAVVDRVAVLPATVEEQVRRRATTRARSRTLAIDRETLQDAGEAARRYCARSDRGSPGQRASSQHRLRDALDRSLSKRARVGQCIPDLDDRWLVSFEQVSG